MTLHEIHPPASFKLGSLTVRAELITHPGPTFGLRIESDRAVLAYLPDHEPALGVGSFPDTPEWTSGFDLAAGADVLIHDAQYTSQEYERRVGWGHSTFNHAIDFATLTKVRRLVTFHHDPAHSDVLLDQIGERIRLTRELPFDFTPGKAGLTIELA